MIVVSGLLSMGSHRVGHDWSDLAVAAAVTFIRAKEYKSHQFFHSLLWIWFSLIKRFSPMKSLVLNPWLIFCMHIYLLVTLIRAKEYKCQKILDSLLLKLIQFNQQSLSDKRLCIEPLAHILYSYLTFRWFW